MNRRNDIPDAAKRAKIISFFASIGVNVSDIARTGRTNAQIAADLRARIK